MFAIFAVLDRFFNRFMVHVTAVPKKIQNFCQFLPCAIADQGCQVVKIEVARRIFFALSFLILSNSTSLSLPIEVILISSISWVSLGQQNLILILASGNSGRCPNSSRHHHHQNGSTTAVCSPCYWAPSMKAPARKPHNEIDTKPHYVISPLSSCAIYTCRINFFKFSWKLKHRQQNENEPYVGFNRVMFSTPQHQIPNKIYSLRSVCALWGVLLAKERYTN